MTVRAVMYTVNHQPPGTRFLPGLGMGSLLRWRNYQGRRYRPSWKPPPAAPKTSKPAGKPMSHRTITDKYIISVVPAHPGSGSRDTPGATKLERLVRCPRKPWVTPLTNTLSGPAATPYATDNFFNATGGSISSSSSRPNAGRLMQ